MKNKTNLIATIFAILIFCVVSTSYGQTSTSIFTPRTDNPNNKWSIVSNTRNPYDEVGLKHNLILDEFINSEEFYVFNQSADKDVAATAKKFFLGYCQRNMFSCPETFSPNNLGELIITMQTETDPMAALLESRVSRLGTAYAAQLYSLVERLPENREFTRSTFTSFFALEERIIADRRLTENDRKRVLMMTSVARYSALYWNRESTTNPVLSANSLRIRWWTVVVADVFFVLVGGPVAAAFASTTQILYELQITRG